MTLFADACEPGVVMTVYLGLMTPTSDSGIWDVSTWDSAASWGVGPDKIDISSYVRSVEINRAFGSDMKSWNAGSISITLNNRDGRFSPDNLEPGAPYVVAGLTGIRPGCTILMTMAYSGITYITYAGYVTDIDEGWTLHGTTPSTCVDDPEDLDRTGDAFVVITGTDEWGRLGRQTKRVAVAPVGAGDSFGLRIARILTSAGYTGSATIDSGMTTFQATDLSSEVLGELNKAAESEGGMIWVDDDGTIIARGRYAPLNFPRSSIVRVAFGDNSAAGEVMWSGISVGTISDQKIINHAIYGRVGGVPQEYRDNASIVLYGVCDDSSQPTDLMCETDAQVAALAQWKVIVGAAPEAAIQNLELKPRCDLATLAPLALSTKMMDLVSVRIRPPSTQKHYLYRECFIAGLTHTISGNDWTVTFVLSTATEYATFRNSKWDSGTWGSSDVDTTGARWFI